jgi:fructose-1,6-bisphosphatase/inositol monophosphatase family enzyme
MRFCDVPRFDAVLLQSSIFVLQATIRNIQEWLARDRRSILEEIKTVEKNPREFTRRIDARAEQFARRQLLKAIRIHGLPPRSSLPLILGEESLEPGRDLSEIDDVVGIFDVIDGTDLLRRGLPNWCSVFLFCIPRQGRVILSLVADPLGNICYAGEQMPAFLQAGPDSTRPLGIRAVPPREPPSPEEVFKDLGIAFYGQQRLQFRSMAQTDLLFSDGGGHAGLNFRLYNLGGNPMLVKVATGELGAVIDLVGHNPHDCIPGAFIAMKAGAVARGATLADPGDWRSLDQHFPAALRRPREAVSKLVYIVAANQQIYDQLWERLKPDSFRELLSHLESHARTEASSCPDCGKLRRILEDRLPPE